MDANFRIIEYREIDLDKTKALLEEQGLLLVDLGWFRARTMMAMLDEVKKLRDPRILRQRRATRLAIGVVDILRLFPFAVASSNLVVLHCIFVNCCTHSEWTRLPNGSYRFTFV